MQKLSDQEFLRQMAELVAEQMARPSLQPRTRLEDEAEAFARETPSMGEHRRRRQAEQESHPN
jgi:hypothetical protein